ARAVVTKERKDFAVVHVDVDPVERDDGSEVLAGTSDRKCRDSIHAHALAAFKARNRSSRRPRMTSDSTAITMTTPITISCSDASMFIRFIPLRMTPIISAPTRACPT